MKKTILLALLISIIPSLMGLAFNAVNPGGIPLIPPPPPEKDRIVDFQQMVFIVSNDQLTVVDARRHQDYDEGHIPGAFSMPEDDFERLYAEFNAWVHESERIVVYCQGGDCESSINLAWKLKGRGYADIMHYTGGFHEWEEAGQEIEYGPWEPPFEDAPLIQVDLGLMNTMMAEGAIAIDLRDPVSFEAGHIRGAVNIPAGYSGDPAEALGDEVYSDTDLLLYGEAEDWDAAGELANVLRSIGFTGAHFYPGGYQEWEAAGEEIETGGAS